MKMDFDRFKEAARNPSPGSRSESGAGELDEAGGDLADDPDPGPPPDRPTMSLDMGPDGTSVSLDAPLNDMDPQEAIDLAQEVQGPSMSEELKELLLDPTVQDILKEAWYGPENVDSGGRAQRRTERTPAPEPEGPTAALDAGPDPDDETAATDGGEELRDGNIYEITPEALVAIMQQQIAELSALRPEMTIEDLETFMAKNEERLVGEASELLEAMDADP
jgi:hypothetical protein